MRAADLRRPHHLPSHRAGVDPHRRQQRHRQPGDAVGAAAPPLEHRLGARIDGRIDARIDGGRCDRLLPRRGTPAAPTAAAGGAAADPSSGRSGAANRAALASPARWCTIQPRIADTAS